MRHDDLPAKLQVALRQEQAYVDEVEALDAEMDALPVDLRYRLHDDRQEARANRDVMRALVCRYLREWIEDEIPGGS